MQDAWARGEPVPYLVSVPDPYENASPHHTWGPFEFTAAKLRAAFKVPGQLVDVKLSINASQRVDQMTLVGTKGEVVVPGEVVRTTLGLRSTWFRVGVLGIEPPAAPVEYGATTKLTGLARGGSKVGALVKSEKVLRASASPRSARELTMNAGSRGDLSTVPS